MLELLIAWVLLVSLILYALLAGADFGGGVWDLLAYAERAKRQRAIIADSIAPVWEANHVWLILVVVLLFSAFPKGFAVIMTALHIPVMVMLLGIVLRGAAFDFRKYDDQKDAVHRRWSLLFGISSLFTPFFQGLIVGALASGEIRLDADGMLSTGFFAGWTSLFAVACGLFAQALFAYTAAVYLAVDAEGQPDLQSDFRWRGLISGVALGPIAAIVFFSAREGAPVGTAVSPHGGRPCCSYGPASAPLALWPGSGGGGTASPAPPPSAKSPISSSAGLWPSFRTSWYQISPLPTQPRRR